MRTIDLISLTPNLRLEVTFQGQMNLVYLFRLFESDKNTIVIEESGDSTGQPFTFDFPSPIESNKGRIVVIRFRFRGIDIVNSPKFVIQAIITQNGTILSDETRDGDYTGENQSVQITIKIN